MTKSTFVKITLSIGIMASVLSCTETPAIPTKTLELKPEKTTSEKEVVTEISGDQIFKKLNCGSCHHRTAKILGPSVHDIQLTYEGESDSLMAFLLGEAKPKMDPTRYNLMKPSISTFKTIDSAEQQKIVDYLLTTENE